METRLRYPFGDRFRPFMPSLGDDHLPNLHGTRVLSFEPEPWP